MDRKIKVVFLGRMGYGQALELQKKLQEKVISGEEEDTLLLVEHPPVLTMGKRAKESNILLPHELLSDMGVDIFEINRGGDVTYHGPGQIVGYPIMNLNNYGRDIKAFVWNIEEIFIRLLYSEFGIKADRDAQKYTGVWVGNDKITAIGIAVRRWVTMHGFAFNVNTELEHFKWITPCGLTDRWVTSIKRITGEAADYDHACRLVVKYFCEVFNVEPIIVDKITFINELAREVQK